MKNYSLSALVAAGLLAGAASTASAADLGGNCCADLEERIAELEATTVRKGNRKVSLTISGWVGEQVTWWDDKHESNAYVTGLGSTLSTHFKFSGSAKITSDVSAGYVLHIEAKDRADPLGKLNQNTDTAGTGLSILESYWYLKSETLGRLSVGQESPPTDNLAILVDGSGSLVQANWVTFEGAGFFLRNGTGVGSAQKTFTWGDLQYCNTLNNGGIGGDCTAGPQNIVRYDSPVFAGFSASASFGEDDFWDVAGRYAGEFVGFKIAASIGYSQATDNNPFVLGANDSHEKVSQIQAGIYVQHIQTGLFGLFNYLREDVSGLVGGVAGSGVAVALTPGQAAFINNLKPEHWYVKGGIRQKWLPYGHTVVYGEYSKGNDQISPTAVVAGVTSTDFNFWGVGVVQEIDAAAMSIWIKYRNLDGSLTSNAAIGALGVGAGRSDFDNLQMVTFGAMISF